MNSPTARKQIRSTTQASWQRGMAIIFRTICLLGLSTSLFPISDFRLPISDLQAAPLAYSSKLSESGIGHHGLGYFRFALLDSRGKVLWTNANTVAHTVPLHVYQGRYTVLLGKDNNMRPISSDIFLNNRTVFLRTQFSKALDKPFVTLVPDRCIVSFVLDDASKAGVESPPKDLAPDFLAALSRVSVITFGDTPSDFHEVRPYETLSKEEQDQLHGIAAEELANNKKWTFGLPMVRGNPGPKKGVALVDVYSGKQPAFDQYGPLAAGLRKNVNHSFLIHLLKNGKVMKMSNGDPIVRVITYGEFDRLRREAFFYRRPLAVIPATEYGKKIAMITKESPTRRFRRDGEEYWENGKRWKWYGDRNGYAGEILLPNK